MSLGVTAELGFSARACFAYKPMGDEGAMAGTYSDKKDPLAVETLASLYTVGNGGVAGNSAKVIGDRLELGLWQLVKYTTCFKDRNEMASINAREKVEREIGDERTKAAPWRVGVSDEIKNMEFNEFDEL
eukprot:TRINITY_DN31115_c0_g1_i1.p1 TRINITY_DN31115_c0_g1~~TRINITY_DN31115_c0_g1_i1.p1  ORF type:complete len:130 (-),score=38.09 TRINITY_DN31115_c0_g1_i1:82-471(-)